MQTTAEMERIVPLLHTNLEALRKQWVRSGCLMCVMHPSTGWEGTYDIEDINNWIRAIEDLDFENFTWSGVMVVTNAMWEQARRAEGAGQH